VVLVDKTPPTLTAAPDKKLGCNDPVVFDDPKVSDNCDDNPKVELVSDTVKAGPGKCDETHTRTWVAKDACGNTSAEASQSIQVTLDRTPPTLTAAPGERLDCNEPVIFTDPEVSDNCDDNPTVEMVSDIVEPGPGQCAETHTRTWIARDACGNTSEEASQSIIVTYDETPPTLTAAPDKDLGCNAEVSFDDPKVSDNCDEGPKVEVKSTIIEQGPGECTETHTRTWVAKDACGNESEEASQSIVVTYDETAPKITAAPDKELGCNEKVIFDDPEVSDNCDAEPTVEIESDYIEPGPGECAETHVRSWIARDECGNVSEEASQRIVVTYDETAPTLTPAPDGRISCNKKVLFSDPKVTDNCDREPVIKILSTTVDPGPGECEETHTRTWVAEDECGNSSEPVSQRIIRTLDEEAPTLTMAPDKAMPCNQPPEFTTPGVSDNCDKEPTLKMVSDITTPGPGKCQETHTRGWIALDACGNMSEPQYQSIVTTTDTQAPELAAAPDQRIEWGDPVIFSPPFIVDNCDEDPIVAVTADIRVSGPEPGESTFTRCWMAQDACGNVSGEACQNIVMASCPEMFCAFGCWDWASSCLDGPNREISTAPGCIRDTYFDEIFPDGVRIGRSDGPDRYEVLWTSAAAVEQYMCGYGIPIPLYENSVNPGRLELGVLAAELLALRLNREYSCYGAFSGLGYDPGESCYGNYVLPGYMDEFAGLTVDALLAVADDAISGNRNALLPYGATYEELYSTIAYLNWLFGECDGGCGPRDGTPLLTDNGQEESPEDGEAEPVTGNLPAELRISTRPNPLQDGTTIRLALPAECEIAVEIFDVQGRSIATLFRGHKAAGYHDMHWDATDRSGAPVVTGVYFCRIETEGQPARLKKLIKM
jgi:hypothetical protein